MNELKDYTRNNKLAMTGYEDEMNLEHGSTCEFIPVLKILDSDWSIFSHKESPYIPLLKYQ